MVAKVGPRDIDVGQSTDRMGQAASARLSRSVLALHLGEEKAEDPGSDGEDGAEKAQGDIGTGIEVH